MPARCPPASVVVVRYTCAVIFPLSFSAVENLSAMGMKKCREQTHTTESVVGRERENCKKMIRNIESKSRTSHGRKTSVLTPPATHRERDEDMQKQAHTNREREKVVQESSKDEKEGKGGKQKKERRRS